MSKAWTVFAHPNAEIVSSNPIWGMDFCVRLLCAYVAALRRADPPSKESYRLYIGLRNWKSDRSPTEGYKIIDR
jgi:hypothetical protein